MIKTLRRKMVVMLSLAMLVVLCLPLSAFANNTFKNPVISDSGDSYAFEDNGWYYLYLPDTVVQSGVKVGGNVVAYKSQNLLDWTKIGTVYTNVGQTYNDGSQNKSVTGIWAPEVHYINGKYYLICVYVSDTAGDDDKDIIVVEGTSPTTFDANSRQVMLGSDTVNEDLYIDPTLFVDTDGSLYMYWKHKVNGADGSSVQGRKMTDPFHFTGSTTTLLSATGNHEHPSMDLKNGHYILFWSGGVGNQTTYTINYATSNGPLGTFTPAAENPIMYSWQTAGVIAPGATSVVLDGDNNRWMVYRQKVDDGTNWNRVVTVNRLVIDSSGNVDILPTRNTYVHKPTPLSGSLPADELQTRIENDNSRVSYTGTWTLDTSASDSGGSSKFAKNSGDKASLTFYGDSIRVGIRTGINSGKADIRLDGTIVANNVDTYSDPTQYQQLIYENDGLTLGTHTISLEATGTKNALAGTTSVRLDYFEYHGQTIADNESSLVTYHGADFHTWNNAGDYNGSISSSQTAGDYVQYTFDGTHVAIYARKAPAAGKVDVYLDGVLVKDNFDLYSSTAQYQSLVYDSGTISAGTHMIKYQTTGLKNSASSGYGSNFDYLESDN